LDIPSQESEESLVARAISHDRAAFTALYEKYVNQIYRHAYYRVGNQADAEDITEEVFIRAWKSIGRFKQTGAPFVSWLITITRNQIIDYYRAQKSHISLDKIEVAASSDSEPGKIAELNSNRERIRSAIRKLKGDKQKVIMMHFIDGFSYSQIASALKKSEGAIRVIQYRALNDLKRILAEQI